MNWYYPSGGGRLLEEPLDAGQALRVGFRPSDPTVPLASADPANPFNKLVGNGIKVELPPVAKTPPGAVVRAVLTMWSRTVAKSGRGVDDHR